MIKLNKNNIQDKKDGRDTNGGRIPKRWKIYIISNS